MNNVKLIGLIYFLAGAIVLTGIITAEAMYPPGYTTFKNEISDIGVTKQPNSVSYEPLSRIFNTVMFLAGILVLTASFYQHKHFRKLLFSIPAMLFGLGLAGVDMFPGNKTPYHGMSAMLAFLSGGLCAITSNKIVTPPFTYIGILFGSVALLTWFLTVFAPASLISFIGIGETER